MMQKDLIRITIAAMLVIVVAFCQSAMAQPSSVTLPKGTKMVIRLDTTLNSKSTKQGDEFKAELLQPVVHDTDTVLPKGSMVYGIVDEVKPVKMKIKKAKIEIVFDRIETPDGRVIPIHAGINKGFDAVGALNKTGGAVGEHVADKALETVTAGLITPLLLAKSARKAIEFAKKDRNVILPAGTILEIALTDPVIIPVKS